MAAMSPLGGLEYVLLAMFFGVGLPLGVPPEKENPVMAYAAPQECLVYATWAGMAAPNPVSSNQTEQLLAEPEVKAFAAAFEKAFASAMAGMQRGGDDPARSARLAQAGPLWARTMITRPAAIFLSKLEPQGNGLNVEGGLILHAGEAAEPLKATLTDLLTSETDKPAEVTIAGRKFMKLTARNDLPVDVVWGANNGYLMIGLGGGAIEDLSTRLAARQEPAWLTQLKTNLPIERRSTISYINVKQLLETFAPLGGPQAELFINSLGLRQITSLQSTTGLDETGMVSRSLLAFDGPARGLLTLADGKGLTAADLKHIPADALVATSLSLDARQALEVFLSALTEVDPNAAASASDGLTQLAAQTGIDVRSALAALGTHWSLHAAAADGGWLGAALTVDLRDRPQVIHAQDRLLANLMEGDGRSPPPGQIFRTPFAGQTIVHFVPRGREIPFLLPAWCITDKHVIFGLNPQAVKSVLLRQPAEKSLADLPEVAARLNGQSPLLALSYSDTRAFFETMYLYAQMVLPMASQALNREGIPLDFAQLPAPRTISKHLRPSVGVVRRTKLGIETETRQTLPGINVGASGPIAVALLLPAVQSARESARRMQGANNLKQQLLAMHNFHDVYNGFPAAYSTNKDGKPLLSWRVQILPFIEQKPLYDEFHHDEPWDSEHNKKLLAKMPQVFRSPNSTARPGMTTYLGVGGKQGVLAAPPDAKDDAPNNGARMADITDGTSNTIMIVEASDAVAVEWTKPVEWVPDEKDPLKGLKDARPNGFNAALADGSVRFISNNIDLEMLRRLFMRDDGNPIQLPDERR